MADDQDYPEPDDPVPSMDPAELYERIRAGDPVSLLDVRNRDEYEEWRIEGESVETTLIPYVKFVQAEITGGVADLAEGIEEPILVVCGRGKASAYVADLLRKEGIEARNLAEGMNGWADVYVAETLDADAGAATVVQYRRPSSGCLTYMVHDGERAAVIDPLRAFTDRYVADATEMGVTIDDAVDTHVHADHVSGVRALATETGATMVLPEGARERGLDPDTFASGVDADLRFVGDGDALAVGEATMTAMAAPGHTTEMLAYRVGQVLVGGDTLFLEAVARPDLERGAEGAEAFAHTLYETLHDRLLALDPETVLAPGHFSDAADPAPDGTYTGTLGEVRERVRALSLDEAAFVDRITADVPPRPANHERIIATNLGREAVDDQEAFELELGPNNCAAAGAETTADD